MAGTTIYSQEFGVNFCKTAMKERLSLSPGIPRFTARRLENPEGKVSPKEHETFRSGVRLLLYLTKHSKPDILQLSEGIVYSYGCTSSSTFERNVQTDKICVIHKRLWPKT